MLTSYLSRGDVIDHVPGSAVEAGDIVVAGEFVGQVVSDSAAGVLVGLRIEGAINSPKLSTDDVGVGDLLYWDAGNSRCTLTASTHKLIGKAIAEAGSGATEVQVKLCPQRLDTAE